MSAKHGRLEARFTFSASVTATFTDSGGPTVVTIASGSYYLTEIIASIASQLGGGWSISVSDGESSATGRCTIDATGTPWSITWTSTTLRDILGFTGNISSVSAAQTGTNHCVGLWLPDVPKTSMYGDSANGSWFSDARSTVSPTGVVRGFFGNAHRRHMGISWQGITGARAMAHQESVSGESFETFMLDALTGRKSYLPAWSYVRLYWDADVDGTYAVGRPLWSDQFDLELISAGWNGKYQVDLPPLVVES